MRVEVFLGNRSQSRSRKIVLARVESRSGTEKNGVGVGVELTKYLRARGVVRVVSILVRLANPGSLVFYGKYTVY